MSYPTFPLTFLKGIKPGYNAAKTFKLSHATLTKVSDYDIGMTFCHQTVTLPYIHKALCDTLKKRAGLGWFHIYGSPTDSLQQKVRRLKENFHESPTRFLVMDIDKYTLPHDIAKQWTKNQPEHHSKNDPLSLRTSRLYTPIQRQLYMRTLIEPT